MDSGRVSQFHIYFDIDASMVNVSHIFRAIMGLYFAFALFWIVGTFNQKFQLPALYSLAIFMIGLGAGRILSLVVDGMPNGVLIFYLFLEVVFGILGCILIIKHDSKSIN